MELRDGSAGYAGTEGEKRRSLLLLTGIVALLFLIGCANVACLLIARAVARQREVAICLSLGASRTRILRQTLMECCLLSTVGGVAGFVVAFWTEHLLLIAFDWTGRPIDLSPDWRVLAFGFAVSLATGLLVGLAPALQMLRNSQITLLSANAPPRLLSGKVLVAIETAICLALITGASVFTRSFQNLRSVPVGFSTERVSVIRLAAPGDADEERSAPMHEAVRLANSLRARPLIESVGLSDLVTFNDSESHPVVTTPGVPADYRHGLNFVHVSPGYFDTLRMHLLAGRSIEARDTERAPRVAILNQSAAQRLFHNQNPVGRIILMGSAALNPKPGDGTQVIGVVNDTKFTSVAGPAPAAVYVPLLQGDEYSSSAVLQVRSLLGPRALANMVRAQIRAAHLPVAVQFATALGDEILASMHSDRLRMQASSLFSALALLLIIAGIYGLMAYSVVRRTREIGIRVAVGSTPSRIVRLMLSESLRLVLAGVVVGIPGAVTVMKAISSMVFGLSPIDPASLAIAALVLAATGIVASAVPAWRAARLDPVTALRVE